MALDIIGLFLPGVNNDVDLYMGEKIISKTEIQWQWKNFECELHRKNGPAEVRYDRHGNILREEWMQHGWRFRLNGPVLILYKSHKQRCVLYSDSKTIVKDYNYDGILIKESWSSDGRRHRTGLPAVVKYYEDGTIQKEEWYDNGKLHRLNLPAITEYFNNGQIKTKIWYTDNMKHRSTFPAHVCYYKNGEPKELIWYYYDLWHKKIQFAKNGSIIHKDSRPIPDPNSFIFTDL